jgi:hypothetical protein
MSRNVLGPYLVIASLLKRKYSLMRDMEYPNYGGLVVNIYEYLSLNAFVFVFYDEIRRLRRVDLDLVFDLVFDLAFDLVFDLAPPLALNLSNMSLILSDFFLPLEHTKWSGINEGINTCIK